jgi:hypothetical protein
MSDALEIAPLRDRELGQLFGLAKTVFASASGWNDRRVLDVLTHDIVFVAHEQGEVGGYVALFVSAGKQVIAEQVFIPPVMSTAASVTGS